MISSYKKQPLYTDPAVATLRLLSKAALIDCVVDMLRVYGESVDHPVVYSVVEKKLRGLIEARGDKFPKQKGDA